MTWERARLKDLGRWYGGGTPSKSNSDFWAGGDVPWLSPKDMGPEVLASTIDHVSSVAIARSSTKLVPAGSVAVVTRSGILERTIPIAVVPFATTMNQDMKAVVPHEGIDARWIAWGLRAYERELLRGTRKAGTTVASIEMPRFYDFELPVPRLDEQRRIVGILEDHLSRVDAARASMTSVNARTAAMEESWLRARLGGDVGITVPLASVLKDIRGGWSRSSAHLVSPAQGRAYLKMNNITRRGRLSLEGVVHVEAGPVDVEKYGVKPGDVLFNSKNSGDLIGKTALADNSVDGALFNENIMRLRFDDCVVPSYAALWFLGPDARSSIRRASRASTNVAAVYQRDLVQFPFFLPPREVQAETVRRFDELRASRERLTSVSEVGVRRAAALRTSLLAAAFSGRLPGPRTSI